MVAARGRKLQLVKVTDETSTVKCVAGEALIREEVWKDSSGHIVRYNLTFICFALYPKDNGRVLGYDTAHGVAHRHFAGKVEAHTVANYSELLEMFLDEVEELKGRKHL